MKFMLSWSIHGDRWLWVLKKSVALVLGGMLAFGAAPAFAQSYSGKWQGAGQGNGTRCPAFSAQITVTGKDVAILVGAGTGNWNMKGTVAADGSFTARGTSYTSTAIGKFAGDVVEFTLSTSCGARPGTGRRAN